MENARSDACGVSHLERVLSSGHFAVCGEIGPPRGADPSEVLRKCEYFRGVVDAVNLTDNQAAVARMSSMAASLLTMQAGLEPIMQMTCRDRNRLAQQSDMLGAAALGIRNILCLSGDHVTLGNHPQAKSVHDLDAVNLTAMMRGLREGHFLSGDEVKTPPELFIGATANPFGEPFLARVHNLKKKVASGAQFIQTQVVFDVPRFEKWMQACRDEGLTEQTYILAGIAPVRSASTLKFMRNNVAGVHIAEEYIQRMSAASSKEDAMDEGVRIAVETIQRVRDIPGVAGVHIMPVMWESVIRRVVEGAGLLPRPDVLESPPAEARSASELTP
ncbi:MAG: methylenetetrahydrofolate reductase [Armatimonadetes bacterium]|nr:methylenetetrahydrofolate reductase [Armatimonadota bacterium]